MAMSLHRAAILRQGIYAIATLTSVEEAARNGRLPAAPEHMQPLVPHDADAGPELQVGAVQPYQLAI